MLPFFVLLILWSNYICAQPEELTFIDQDLARLTEQVGKLNQERNTIQKQLEVIAQQFQNILQLIDERATKDNPFKKLALEFKNPKPHIDTLKTYAKIIQERTYTVSVILNRKSEQNKIAAIEYFTKIMEIFDDLNSKISPDIRAIFKLIVEQLNKNIEELEED